MYLPKLTKAVLILLFLFMLIAGVILAKEFLLPMVFALLFSMLLLKRVKWLERKGFPRWLAILTCLSIVLLVIGGVATLIGWQVTNLDAEISEFNRSYAKIQTDLKKFIRETLGLSWRDADELVSNAAQTDKAPQVVAKVLAGLTSIFANSVLILVYVFLLLYLRTHLVKFLLKLVPENKKQSTNTIIKDSINVSHGYIAGLAKMIVCLWVMYGIGFSIVGIKNPIMFALLCGTLEIIPFVGNLAGTAITVIMALIQGGGPEMVIGLLCVYALVQFIQTYLLEPLVVGTEVNLNPLFTIVALILGEVLWGIPGMVVAIPVLGIVKIVCDNVEELKPYGFLLGQEKGVKKRADTLEELKKKIGK